MMVLTVVVVVGNVSVYGLIVWMLEEDDGCGDKKWVCGDEGEDWELLGIGLREPAREESVNL
jgi:hypothetical protein